MDLDELHLVTLACWPVGDPFELALFTGALTAAAYGHAAYLNAQLGQLAEACLERCTARAQA